MRAEVSGHGSRRVGTATLNLAEFRNKAANEINFKVESNLDRNCFVRLSIVSTLLDDAMIGDNMSDASGGASFNSGEGMDFEFSGLMPNIDQDLAGLEDKKPSRQATVVINKARLAHKREIAPEDDQAIDALMTEIKGLKAQVSVFEKDIKHLTKERNQFQVSTSLLESAVAAEKETNDQLVTVLEERIKLNTQHYEDKLKKADSERDALIIERQQLLEELEAAHKATAELKLETSDLQLKVERLRQQSYQCSSQERELELRNAKVLRLSRELEKAFNENSKLIQTVSHVKGLLDGVQDYEVSASRIASVRQALNQLNLDQEQMGIAPAPQPILADDTTADRNIADLKSQLASAVARLADATRQMEGERLERANIERRLKSRLEEYERKCSRMSIESVQLKERQTLLDAAIEQHLDTKERAKRSSILTLGATDKLEKYKADINNFKRERLQMKRLIDSAEADNRELRKELSETRQKLVETASGASEDGKLLLLQLKNKLEDQSYCFSVEKSQLTDRVFQLETEFDILERKKNTRISELEQDLAKLHALQKQAQQPSNAQTSLADEKWQQLLTDLKLKNADAMDQLTQMENDRFRIESMLVDSRAAEKKHEQVNAELLAKLNQGQEQVNELRGQNLMLEKELVKLNERLGTVLNMNNELEEELMLQRRARLLKQR